MIVQNSVSLKSTSPTLHSTHTKFFLHLFSIFLLLLFLAESQSAEFEYELDAYYSNAGFYFDFKKQPPPIIKDDSELTIYKTLFKQSFIPSFMLIEASINPMPVLGVLIRSNYSDFYDEQSDDNGNNIIQSITAGFEEPWALSLFLGNRVSYTADKESILVNRGFTGYLLSIGDHHIQNNRLVDDSWYEVEWKVKGTREINHKSMEWSFRLGSKQHRNPDISDTIYIALKRKKTFLKGQSFSWLHNGAAEFKLAARSGDHKITELQLLIDKKFPLTRWNRFLSLGFGVIHSSKNKYLNDLALEESTTFVIRPSIDF